MGLTIVLSTVKNVGKHRQIFQGHRCVLRPWDIYNTPRRPPATKEVQRIKKKRQLPLHYLRRSCPFVSQKNVPLIFVLIIKLLWEKITIELITDQNCKMNVKEWADKMTGLAFSTGAHPPLHLFLLSFHICAYGYLSLCGISLFSRRPWI